MTDLTHHPDCGYWLDNRKADCCCGLDGDARPGFRPWSQAAFDEWARAVRAYQRERDDMPELHQERAA